MLLALEGETKEVLVSFVVFYGKDVLLAFEDELTTIGSIYPSSTVYCPIVLFEQRNRFDW